MMIIEYRVFGGMRIDTDIEIEYPGKAFLNAILSTVNPT
jgi:hypothetical protein